MEYVSDFFLLCACAIEEIRSLIAWLYKNAITDIAVAGVSKGGYIAVVAGAVSQLPVSVAALVAPINGIAVFIDGLTGKLCDWRTLQATAPAYGSAEKRMREIFEATSIERIAHPNHKKMIVIGARKDKFVPLMYHQLLGRHWEETEVRWLHGGHVSSILERMHFLSAITSCFDPETCQSV
ncbi:MAG: abhydrolase domain-containing 18 [Gammaproteobacteria bacterium]|nr:abhydrolase domain-containing 18 [Gammaproteobacteria bacterium]